MPVTNGTWTGTLPIALSASGLPAGVNFADNGNASYTLSGIFPPAGSYLYNVTGTNIAGTTVSNSNQILTIPNVIVIGSFVNPAPCAIATDPACGQYSIQLRPNGQIWVGDNNTLYALAGNWHDGTVAGAGYELMVENLGGVNPTIPAVNTWLSLGGFIDVVYDHCGIGEDFNQIRLTVRDVNTQVIMGYVAFCQQVGVDVICATC